MLNRISFNKVLFNITHKKLGSLVQYIVKPFVYKANDTGHRRPSD